MTLIVENNPTPPIDSRSVSWYKNRDRTLVVSIANTPSLRNEIYNIRNEHYADTLRSIGVPTWDKYDAIATHFVCVDGKAVVASMRGLVNTCTWGEVFDDFPDLSQLLHGFPHFLSFSRELVVPNHRLSSVTVVLAHAATSWWLSFGEQLDIVSVSLLPAVRGAMSFGFVPASEVRHLGRNNVPVQLIRASLHQVADRAASVLKRRGWDWGESFAPIGPILSDAQ